MPPYGPPPHIEINPQQAADFLNTLQAALESMNKSEIEEVRLVVWHRAAIAISLDKNKRPFLGTSAGYNPPSQRVMLANDNWLINRCKFWFIARRKSTTGGRFFIQSQRAFTDPRGAPEIVLCTWRWPGPDVVQSCLDLLEQAYRSK